MGTTAYSTIVIGAGASGMMAAVTAAGRGLSVLVLEQGRRTGRKLLATGNGKCNFTNEHLSLECYHGDGTLLTSVLSRFSRDECLEFFHGIGIMPKNQRGYYYPNSGQASSVADALEAELIRLGVTVVTEASVLSVLPERHGFVCKTSSGTFRGRNVIFATGLLASPKLGSNGSAIPVIKGLGHHFTPLLPALCGFYCEGMDFHQVSGVRCDARLTLEVDGQLGRTERGELQLADYGLSGIPMFQLSSEAVRSLYAKKTVRVHLDFLPGLEEDALARELFFRRKRQGQGTAAQMLCGLLHSKLIPVCLRALGLSAREPAGGLSDGNIRSLAGILKDIPVTLVRARGLEYAQVCTGGIRTEEIHPETLESKLHPGLYFVGELLDVDGICGGYNLQWAWSTGFVAASSIR